MSSTNLLPSISFLRLSTKEEDSPYLILYEGEENRLTVEFTICGLNERTIPQIHEQLDYIALHITLFHQFGGKETTTVRRFVIEYDPGREIFKDVQDMMLDIPVDDDFLDIDFISNYYFLQMSFTHKHLGEMGLDESVYVGKFFETKVPFKVFKKEK